MSKIQNYQQTYAVQGTKSEKSSRNRSPQGMVSAGSSYSYLITHISSLCFAFYAFLLFSCSDHSNVVDPGADESIAGWFRKETSGLSSSATSGTSSAVGTSSATASSSSFLATSSAAASSASTTTVNTQTCTYAASGTTHGSTGTLACPEENKAYATVVIGTQTWMAENLAWLPSVNAQADYSSTDAEYYVYGYDGTSVSAAKSASSYTTYGVLYNYPAAIKACPTGWHLPTDAEWQTMEMYLGMTSTQASSTGWRGTDQGTQLKSTSALWVSGGVAGTNTSQFSALPGGRYSGGSFLDVGDIGFWWTATPSGSSSAYYRYMSYDHASVYRSYDQGNGFSVRCLKD